MRDGTGHTSDAEMAAGALLDARNRASEARQAIYALAPPDPGAGEAEYRAWHERAAALRTTAGAAEVALRTAEQEAAEAAEWSDNGPPAGGMRVDGDRELLRGAPSDVREFVRMTRKAKLSRFVSFAMRGERLGDGVEAEIRQSAGLGDDALPFEVLDPGYAPGSLQERVDATAGGLSSVQTVQERILQRVFARAAAVRVLGCRMIAHTIPGDCLIPIIEAGQTPAFTGKQGRVDAAAGTLGVFVREPKRLSGAWRFAVEDEARIGGYESSLRIDLGRSMSNALDKQILGLGNGQVRGLLATAANGGIADLTAANAVVTYALMLAQFGRAVDGLHAGSTKDCTLIVRPEVYNKLLTLFNTGSGQLGTQTAMDLFAMFESSDNLPAPTNSHKSTGIIARRGQADGMNSFIPTWMNRGLRLIRDEITRAAEGEIRLTATMLANHALARPAGFTRTVWQTA